MIEEERKRMIFENYENNSFEYFYYDKSDEDLDHFELLDKMGFEKVMLCSPYFYNEEGVPYVEVNQFFRRESKDYLIEL